MHPHTWQRDGNKATRLVSYAPGRSSPGRRASPAGPGQKPAADAARGYMGALYLKLPRVLSRPARPPSQGHQCPWDRRGHEDPSKWPRVVTDPPTAADEPPDGRSRQAQRRPQGHGIQPWAMRWGASRPDERVPATKACPDLTAGVRVKTNSRTERDPCTRDTQASTCHDRGAPRGTSLRDSGSRRLTRGADLGGPSRPH